MHINENGIHSLSLLVTNYVQLVMKDFGIFLQKGRDEHCVGKWEGN